MKKTTTCYLHMGYDYDFSQDIYEKRWRPIVRQFKYEDDECVFIREMELTVDIPDDFDPVPKQVAALEKAKLEALAVYQRAVAELNEKLSKLQAIEYAP